jgi:hypothetical protein
MWRRPMQPTHRTATHYPRDLSRDGEHKARALTRRKARVAKSALLFLAWAFPADMTSH